MELALGVLALVANYGTPNFVRSRRAWTSPLTDQRRHGVNRGRQLARMAGSRDRTPTIGPHQPEGRNQP